MCNFARKVSITSSFRCWDVTRFLACKITWHSLFHPNLKDDPLPLPLWARNCQVAAKTPKSLARAGLKLQHPHLFNTCLQRSLILWTIFRHIQSFTIYVISALPQIWALDFTCAFTAPLPGVSCHSKPPSTYRTALELNENRHINMAQDRRL